ncbi:MAG: hypothetical protein QW733_01910 [Desulfurococcaceae archaeon]
MNIEVCTFPPPGVDVSMWAIVWDEQVPYAFMFFGDDGIYIVGQGEEFTRLYMTFREEVRERVLESAKNDEAVVFDRYRIEFIGEIPKCRPTALYLCKREDGSRVLVLPLENKLLVYGSESPEEIENIINAVRRFIEQKAQEG